MLVMQFLASMKPEHDGVTRVAFRMRSAFNQHRARHLYVTTMTPEAQNEDIIKVPSLPFPLSTGYRLAICSTATIRALLLKHKPDVVHIHSPCTLGRAAVRAASSLNIPVVATYHTHFPSYFSYYRVGFLQGMAWKYLRSLYNPCQSLIVPSRAVATELESHGLKNLVCIPHGVDTTNFSPTHRSVSWREQYAEDGKIIVSFIGRLVWEKNLKILAEAISLLSCPDKVQVLVVGDGPARSKLAEMMPNAHFSGQLTLAEVATAYASSDIFIFPSLTETFGNVTVEAMASGLVPICAAAGGACDLIQSGTNGLLVTPNNAAELAQAIERLVLDSELRKKLAAGALATAPLYDWSVAVDKYENIYEKLARTA